MAGLIGLVAATTMTAADAAAGRKDKSSFLSAKEQSFIRPGLAFEIVQGWVEADGTVKYRFTLTDPRGLPLDREGVTTPGPISVRSVVARIPAGQDLYVAYTSRTQTSPINGDAAEQAAFDFGGSFEKVGDGEYVYTFGAKLPSGFDASTTHTVSAWANRDLEEFELGEAFDADTLDWVPDGSPVTKHRLVVSDQKCNQCHEQLEAHDNRTEVAVCITCHTTQSTDPDTGNSVDFTQMVHKIHMGAELPSVQAGQPYQIIGFRQSVHDYSAVVYPADVRNCQTCHLEDSETIPAPLTAASTQPSRTRGRTIRARTAAASAPQPGQSLEANQHLLNPSQRACGSCHDDVNFATGENHADLPQISDNQCSRCHTPLGELPFDLSIKGAHTVERLATTLPGTNFEIFEVTNSAPGQNPRVTFGITNDAGEPVAPSEMGRLALVLAGEIGDAADFGGIVSESATGAEGSAGRYTHTFEAVISEDARGTWAVGIEGYQNAVLLPGTVQERSVRDAGDNVVAYFSTTGGPATPRRMVVAQAKCDSCHYDLNLHGSNRNNVEHCVLCHNPNTTDVNRRPEDQGAPESVNFKDMIHRIHTGAEQQRDLTIFGFGGTPHNYNEVELPQSAANCSACHIDGTEELPLASNLLPTVDPRGFFNPAPAVTAACTSCHASSAAAAHSELNISPSFGEACEICHGEGAEFAVDKEHAR